MINKMIFKLGCRIRNDMISKKFKELKRTEKMSIEELEKIQLEKLKSLLEFASKNSTYYKKKFEEENFKVENIITLNDLPKVPLLEKNELKKYSKDIQIKKGFKKLFFSETSGSTGEPLVFYRNDEWDAGHRAAIYRGYSWYNVYPWERNGYLWGYNISKLKSLKVKLLDFLQNRTRIFSYSKKNIKKFAKTTLKMKYIEGYSSVIYEISKEINQKNLRVNKNIKMIKGTSEKIYESYQIEVEKAFGKKMISEYGAAEAGIIAFECPYGNMHITMENIIVEEIDGEIVVTNLLSKSFPIIRYKLGDSIILNKNIKCKCGMNHYVIQDVLGRVGQKVVGFNEIYPSLTFYYIFKNLAVDCKIILNYQVEQRVKGELKFYIEQKLDKREKEKLEKEIKKYFGNDIKFTVEDEVDIKSRDKKQKDFISYL